MSPALAAALLVAVIAAELALRVIRVVERCTGRPPAVWLS